MFYNFESKQDAAIYLCLVVHYYNKQECIRYWISAKLPQLEVPWLRKSPQFQTYTGKKDKREQCNLKKFLHITALRNITIDKRTATTNPQADPNITKREQTLMENFDCLCLVIGMHDDHFDFSYDHFHLSWISDDLLLRKYLPHT